MSEPAGLHRHGDDSGLSRAMMRAAYATGQGLRVAWYASHYALARRLSGPFDRPGEPAFRPQSQPDARRVREAFVKLFQDDLANIEAGLYPAPRHAGFNRLGAALRQSRRFFADLPAVDRRRMHRAGVEARSVPGAERFPVYYRQNFHYQTGGWLTQDSADLYDTQVEVLFTGAADAMRRHVLGDLARAMAGRDQRRFSFLDIACGSGRFLEQVLSAFPRLRACGLDLSPAYAAAARSRLSSWRQVEIVEGPVEAMAFADASQDAVSAIYLFHELPPRVRRDAAREIARVLKPGGVFLFADSLQTGDAPGLDGLLEYFPEGFHEPFYRSYLNEDFADLFAAQGLHAKSMRTAFLTKVQAFQKAG
jgi:ubiquinone/menaquinone biosynthesis C-methylase UbiE